MPSWQIPDRTVPSWTVAGRVKDVALTATPEQLATLALHRKGESGVRRVAAAPAQTPGGA
jgi:hypothetical protein